ncbi:MAG: HD domain protein [Alphaproteobacteria bacterium ADurb.Bin438]|nr:MAG: HD domain protein [Alphaproteobacteria bacterium ADurb.Bin438]
MANQYPSVDMALKMLEEAKVLSDGFWIAHSKNVGEACRLIALKCPNMDVDKAYVCGLLHDIGRRFQGKIQVGKQHTINGYRFLMENGFDDVAKICLTHSFPNKDEVFCYGDDCSDIDNEFIENFVKSCEYDDYDRLVQLCDMLATDKGILLLEQRCINIALRYPADDREIKRWRHAFKLKEYFSEKVGTSVYNLFPNFFENVVNYKQPV